MTAHNLVKSEAVIFSRHCQNIYRVVFQEDFVFMYRNWSSTAAFQVTHSGTDTLEIPPGREQ
jgi:hypothetical protein